MEPPPFSRRRRYNHSYVSHPRPPPPPPPPPKDPDNHRPTNFLTHHHPPPQPPPQFHPSPSFHPQPPPRPPPPPPPPPPRPPTQLQPHYDPHRSQFTFFNHHPPIEDDTRRRLLFHFDLNPQSPPPRVRTDHWAEPTPRVLPDHHQNRPLPIPLDHRTPPHDQSLAVRRPVSYYRSQGNDHQLDLERSFHFRDDYVGGFRTYRNENFLWARNKTENLVVNDDDNMLGHCRDDYMLKTDRSSRNIALDDSLDNFDPIMPQDFVPNVRNCESFHGYPLDSERFRASRDEDEGLGHSNQLQREGRSFISGMENSDYSRDDGNVGIVIRRETGVFGLGRFHGRERESGTEFIHTPKKAQKKSALLRVQLGKPNNRTRSHDQHFSEAFFDESKPSPFKGKDKDSFQYLHHGGEEEREGSPVELDVSFKSNALVAKAVVAASDSAAVESVKDLTPRNRRIRKLTLSDSPLTNSFKDSVRLYSSAYGSNCPSSFEKAPKRLSKKITNTSPCKIGPELCVNGTNECPGTTIKRSPKSLISDQGCTGIEPDGTPSLRIKKRKRLRTPLSSTSGLQLREQNVESFNVVGSISGKSAASVPAQDGMLTEAKDTSSGGVTAHGVVMLLPSDEKSDPKIDQFPRTILSLPSSPDTNSILASVPEAGRAIQVEHNNIDVGADTIDRSACDTEPILGFGKDFTETTVFGNERVDTSEQSSENQECGVASTQTIDPMGNVVVGIQNPLELTFSDDHVSKKISFDGTCDASSSAHGLMNRIDNIIVSQAKVAEIGSEKPLLSCVVTGEILNVVPLVECNPVLGMPKTDETRMHGVASTADSSKLDLSTTYNGDPEHTGSPGNISDHNTSLVDNNSNVSGEILPMEGWLKPKCLLGNYADVGSGQDYTPKVKRKRQNRKRKRKSNPLGVFGIPRSNDRSGNVAGLAHATDSSFCFPVKDIVSADQKHLVSSSRDSDVGSKPCTAGNSDRHCNNLNEVFSEFELSARDGVGIGPSGTSPKYTKKRKVLSPGLSSSMPSEICADASMPCAEPALYVDKGTALSEEEFELSEIGTFCSSALPTSTKIVELECNLVGISVGLAGDCCTGNCSRNESSWMSKGEADRKEDISLGLAVTSNSESCITDMENSVREEKVAAVNGIQEQVMHGTDTLPCRPPSSMWTPDSTQGTPSIFDNFLPVKDNSPSVANDLSPLVNGDGISASNSGDEFVDSVPDSLSNMGSPVDLCINSDLQLLSTRSKSSETVCGDGRGLYENSVSLATCSDTTKINATLGNPKVRDLTVSTKTEPNLSHDTKSTMALSSTRAASSLRQNPPSSTCFRRLPPKLSSNFSTTRKAVHLNHFAKPLTWHRTTIPSAPSVTGAKIFSNPVLPQRQWHKDVGNVQSSYIRKGNSLVRKPSQSTDLRCSPHASNSSVYQLNPLFVDEIQKSKGSESRVVGSLNSLGKGVSNASLGVKPLPTHSTELPRNKNIPVGGITAEPSRNSFSANASDPLELADNSNALKPCNDVPKFSEDASKSCGTPEHKTSPSNSLEIQSAPYEGHPLKKMTYLKQKSNQLVAASNSGDLSAQGVDKTQELSSDGYYKKRKNQLIRTSLESHAMQRVALTDDHLNPERQWVLGANPSRSSGNRQHREGLVKTQKLSKCSLVWSRQSTGKDVDPLLCQKVWPHFFPWKRATYWKNYMHNLSSIPSSSLFNTISRKLLLSRKRNAIYRRSSHGFSLRISKVLSIGGSNLKWSKSIEKRSRKVNEEATLAVAAAEKRKREQSVTGHIIAGSKCRNQTSRKSAHSIRLHPGERIFRIGSVRYKMDPTRHTLQRISDGGSSLASVQSDKDSKKSYVPRRLLIGNDEYVRIGNGNQLVRNPKRRTRILASEKVRWSLHTARLRLSRKKKYCQFFTRFGKCNKDSGKCPFIHDPSKIVVCTKFLNGSCSDAKCKLTHKVIPERMQDCSYFLQGLCSNENCPYRHVNVNSNASVCQGFLRGYCAEGNECQKKHTYACSIFEATGTCPQGSKCKLHHPKNREKGMKRKSLREQRNANGRYFGTRHINAVECKTAVSEMHSAKEDEDFFCRDGKFIDFISLDTNDEEAKEFSDLVFDESSISGSDVSDEKVPDLEQLIKPVRIMNRNLTIQTPSPVDSPTEKSASSISLDFDCFKV